MSDEDAGRRPDDAPADGARHGVDLAREALRQAREDAAARRAAGSGTGRHRPSRRPPVARPRGEDGEPVTLGMAAGDFLAERGWQQPVSVAAVTARWADVVGPDVAAHSRAERFGDGQLTVVAESTAWATQLRMLAPAVLARLAEEIGPGLVTRLVVHGPTAADWRHGPLRVRGPGPRDTYG